MQLARKFALLLYRTVALTALYGIMAGLVIYVGTIGFYTLNTSWIVPASLTPTDSISLGFSDRLVTSQNEVSTLRLDIEREQMGLREFREQRTALLAMLPAFSKAIQMKHTQDRQVGLTLAGLSDEKQEDTDRTARLVADRTELEAGIEKDLKAGLITKDDAAQSRMQLNQARNELTENKISGIVLEDTILQRSNSATMDADALAKQLEIREKIAAMDTEITVGEKQLAFDDAEIQRIQQATSVATGTPYYQTASSSGPVYLAFVPYEHQKGVVAGTPIYDCYLEFVGCRYVGSVKQVFQDEEKVQNPILKTDMRGFLVQLELSDTRAIQSKTLFAGNKPLGI